MATPVSLRPLKRVEVHDGSTKKTFDSISQSSPLMLSIEAQQSTDAVKPLLLLVHSGSQRLLSVRLSDLLKPTNDIDDIVSNSKIELSLSIRIPSQGQVLAVFFVEMRDHTMTVCTLQKTGFRVKDQGSISSPNDSLHESTFPPTLGAVARPRLSSITPVTSLSQASQIPSMLSTQPVSSNEDHFGGRVWPSYDHGGVSMSQPQLPSHSLISPFNYAPAVPHVASAFVGRPCFPPPVSVDAITGSMDSSGAYRPRVSSPLRFAFQSAEPLRSWSNPVTISPYQLPASTYDAVLHSQDSQATDTVQSVLNLQSPAGSHVILGRSFSDLTSSSPDLGALPGENRLPAPNVTFRDFLPAPRQLPFSASTPNDTNGAKDKTSSKSAVSRKRKIPADDAASKQPKKSRMAKSTLEKNLASTSVLQMKKKTLRRESRASHKAAPTVTSRSLKAEALVDDGHSMDAAQGNEEPLLKGRTTAVLSPAPKEGPTTRKGKAGLSVNALSPIEKHQDQSRETSSRKEQTTRKPPKRVLNGASPDLREETHTQKKASARGKSSCAALPSQGFTEPKNQAPAATRPQRDRKKVARMARVQVEECQQAQQAQRSVPSGAPQKKPQPRPKRALKKSRTNPIAVKEIPALEQNAHALLNRKQKGSSSNKRKPKVAASTSKNKQDIAGYHGSTESAKAQSTCLSCRKAHRRCGRELPICTRCEIYGLVCIPASTNGEFLRSHKPSQPVSPTEPAAVELENDFIAQAEALSTEVTPGGVLKTRRKAQAKHVSKPSKTSTIPNRISKASAARPNNTPNQPDFLPVVFDTTMKVQLQQLTEPIFRQYEVDVARGCNEGTSAIFYLEWLHSARKGFWNNAIREVDGFQRGLIEV